MRRGLRARWRARPGPYSRALWALVIGLDVLPWPWGEDILAGLFMVVGVARSSRRRRALAWALAQPGHRHWRVAAALCAFRGRWVARASLLGLRRPDDLRPHLVVEGEEHLAAAPRGAVLLGFHLGPPNVDVALRILGYRVTWMGMAMREAQSTLREAWHPVMDSSHALSPAHDWNRWPGLLYRARRILLDGGKIYLTGDGGGDRELFSVSMPRDVMIIRAGWLALHRFTGAPVLPVLTHLEGHTQIVTVHAALPPSGMDPAGDIAAWRAILASLLHDYVRRFPDQCAGHVLGYTRADEPPVTAPRPLSSDNPGTRP